MSKPSIPVQNPAVITQTSKTSPAIAQKIKEASVRVMKRNYQLYKDLENK